jgi:hypothetical protein
MLPLGSSSCLPAEVLWTCTNPLPTGWPASLMAHMRAEVPFGQGAQTGGAAKAKSPK